MKSGRDDNNDKDQWDISQWDLDDDESPDDFDEFVIEEPDPEEIELQVIEGLDEDEYSSRTIWTARIIRLTALFALIVFITVFIAPSVIQGVNTFLSRPSESNYLEFLVRTDPPLRFDRSEIRYSIVYPPDANQSLINQMNGPLARALRSWDEPLGDRIDFVPASSSSSDDLLITFVKELDSAGLATLRPGPEYRPSIFIKINIEGQFPSSMMIETVACHEIGHALGLWGHSDWRGDCMYPIATRRTPSQRDIETIRLVYSMDGD